MKKKLNVPLTDDKQAEEELNFRNILLTTQLETSIDGILVVDENDIILSYNRRFVEMMSIPRKLIETKNDVLVLKFVTERMMDPGQFLQRVKHLNEYKHETSREEIILKDGKVFDRYSSPMFGKDDQYYGRVWYFRDITERKQTELELLNEKNQLKTIIDSSPISIWFKDTKNNLLRVNEAAAKIANLPVQDVQGHSVDEIFPNESVEYFQDDMEVINSGKPKLGVIESATAKGKITWLKTDKVPWFDKDGNVAGIITFAIDITDRMASEKKIISSELRYRRLFESAKDGILILDFESGEIMDVNPYLIEMLGYSNKELLGKELWQIGVFKNIVASKNAFIELQKAEYIRFDDIPFETKKRKKINVEFVSNVYEVENKKVIQCNIRDITERKKAEEKLQMLAHSIASIQECVSITDNKDRIIFVNDAFLKTYGYSRDELIGAHIHILQPDDVKIKIGYQILSHSINGGWKGEVINQRKDGSLFPIYLSTSVIKDNEGNPMALIGVAADISSQKLAREELIHAKEKAEEMNRLKSSFLNNMSHELRTPLIGILGFTDILEAEIVDPEHRKMISLIRSGGKRLSDTLNLILDLSKTEAENLSLEIKPSNLSELTKMRVANYEGAAIINGLSLKTVINFDNFYINTNERLYSQILDNLVNNAIKFTDKGGIGVILDKEIKTIDGKSESFAVLKVIDSGIGIEKENYKLIFEEYRQVSEGLSRSFQGSGLGLTVTKKFVEKLGGIISVESKVGSGSTFTVKLPAGNIPSDVILTVNENKITTVPEIKTVPPVDLPNVLMVDDDLPTFNVSAMFLKNICRLEYAANGLDSIDAVKKNKFDLILLDINLGYGMNGLSALKEIRNVPGYEKIPAVAVSAYSMSGDKEIFLNAGCDYYLSKPFEKTELQNLVSGILNRSHG
ncbi:MAG: PAS domain S-box protein [Ignavibacteriaceae bacterium]|nr:PAS domain S-box protein [Ignavibacteriaceae bacterium]